MGKNSYKSCGDKTNKQTNTNKQTFQFQYLSSENRAVCEVMWKKMWQTTEDSTAHALYMLGN
jgi:hypothetical protein